MNDNYNEALNSGLHPTVHLRENIAISLPRVSLVNREFVCREMNFLELTNWLRAASCKLHDVIWNHRRTYRHFCTGYCLFYAEDFNDLFFHRRAKKYNDTQHHGDVIMVNVLCILYNSTSILCAVGSWLKDGIRKDVVIPKFEQ